jgi:hypothetical protein
MVSSAIWNLLRVLESLTISYLVLPTPTVAGYEHPYSDDIEFLRITYDNRLTQ